MQTVQTGPVNTKKIPRIVYTPPVLHILRFLPPQLNISTSLNVFLMNMPTLETPRSNESLTILNLRDGRESSIAAQCEINESTITEATLIEELSHYDQWKGLR